MLKFLDALEEIDDVQKVYSNAEISTDVLTLLNEY
jgi:transcriptional/translational regulatory protein YebC/TACO1